MHRAPIAVLLLLVAACSASQRPAAPAPTDDPAAATSPDGTVATTPTATPPAAPATPGAAAPSTAAASGPTGQPSGAESPPTRAEVPLTAVVMASGLEAPWDIAFTADGRVFVTERDTGRLLEVLEGGAAQEVQRLEVDARGEGGLLGLAAGPSGMLYAYLTTSQDNRVVRFAPGTPPAPLLTGIPAAAIHNGGRIAFGPDGMLYVATGDAGEPERSQDPGSLGGKILRVTPEGGVPPDNPFAGSPVWSLGHRNVQGLAWTADGTMYATEFGPDRDDEINRIVPGGNYGWPAVTGQAGDPRFVDPVVVRQPPEAAWSGATILRGGAVPQWEGDLLAAALRGRRLWRVPLDGGAPEPLFVGEYGRLRTAVQAPDGSVWLLTSNRDGRGDPVAEDDRIIRIGP